MSKKLTNSQLINNISALLESSRNRVVSVVNHTIVLTYFEIGRMIVEEEQNGKNRAEYGKYLLKDLSLHLTKKFGRGFSVENLDRMRFFYKTYSEKNSSTVFTNSKNQISSTLLTKLQNIDIQKDKVSERASLLSENQISLSKLAKSQTQINFNLSWSHYLKLMRIEDKNERKFYEIESFKNNWSLRELKRQYDSALYTRLSLSKNKDEILKLSEKGQMQMYVNYYDREIKLEDENKTIGIILCQDKSNALVEYTLPENNNQIFASQYMTILPTKEELKKILEN